MLVVSDSSPLNALIRMNAQSILPRLFGIVMIPTVVESELLHPGAPLVVREFLSAKPDWLEVRTPARSNLFRGSIPAKKQQSTWP